MKRGFVSSVVVAIIAATFIPLTASAHVVVTPNQAAIGKRVLFSLSVPNEKEVAVSGIKLDVPSGLEDVQPNVIAGWTISTTTNDKGDVTSITWRGTIPVGQRADFAFKAQVPGRAGDLNWKAYQTYADGSTTNWDQAPVASSKDHESSDAGPYSTTKVVDDLATPDTSAKGDTSTTLALIFSIAALILSIGGLFLRRKKQ